MPFQPRSITDSGDLSARTAERHVSGSGAAVASGGTGLSTIGALGE